MERRAKRAWVGAVILNAAAMGVAAAAILGPRSVAAWAGLLPLATAPTLAIPAILRRRGHGAAERAHRDRPPEFPPPG